MGDAGTCRIRTGTGRGQHWDGLVWRGTNVEIRSTTVEYRPAMMLEDFEDAGAEGWLASGNWGIDTSAGGDKSFKCTGEGTALAGVPMWGDYIMSVDLKSLSAGGEAGIVFHATDALNFYFLSVTQSAAQWSVWKYVNGVRQGSPSNPLAGPKSVAITEPMTLRMTRLDDGRFLCYVNGTHLEFNDTSYTGGMVGLRVESGEATFDNVSVHGANAFFNLPTGQEDLLIDDPFTHLTDEGTPYMWGHIKRVSTGPEDPGWGIVMDDAAHGKVLRLTGLNAQAFRGEKTWGDYFAQTEIKLESSAAYAGIFVRFGEDLDRCYLLQLNGASRRVQFYECRFLNNQWVTDPLDPQYASVSDAMQWNTIGVLAEGTQLKCFVGGSEQFTVNLNPLNYFEEGIVGLWAVVNSARFDNVEVLDLR